MTQLIVWYWTVKMQRHLRNPISFLSVSEHTFEMLERRHWALDSLSKHWTQPLILRRLIGNPVTNLTLSSSLEKLISSNRTFACYFSNLFYVLSAWHSSSSALKYFLHCWLSQCPSGTWAGVGRTSWLWGGDMLSADFHSISHAHLFHFSVSSVLSSYFWNNTWHIVPGRRIITFATWWQM